MSDQNSKNDKGIDKDMAGMNILKKIMATIRTESRELTDAVLGSYGTVKIEQEFETAQFKLKQAKQTLTEMMAKQRQSSRIYDITIENINQQETLILAALNQGNETQAMKHALEVVDLESNRNIQVESLSSIDANINYLQRQLEQSERELKEYSRQLSMVKTTEKVQKATETIMSHIDKADANLMSAKKSLDRIREQQKSKSVVNPCEQQILKDYSQKNLEKNSERKTEIKTELQNPEDSKSRAQKVINRIQDKQ